MRIRITPNHLSGTVAAVPSKSYAHRQLILAALSSNESFITINTVSEDIEATSRCLTALGASVIREADGLRIIPVGKVSPRAVLDCGESGSTLRFMMPVCAALGVETHFICRGRLGSRPIGELRHQLEAHGISFDTDHKISGQLTAGEYAIPGNVSSQYITGLLMALSLLDAPSVIRLTTALESASYVGITLDAMAKYGASVKEEDGVYPVDGIGRFNAPAHTSVEGDWSNGAFWLVSGVKVTGLNKSSAQGDRAILSVMENMGAVVEEDGGIRVRFDRRLPTVTRVTDIPDIVPPIALLYALAEGESSIVGGERLRLKESDRIRTVCDVIRALGGDARESDDGMVISGGGTLSGGVCDGAGDHRIVMTAAVAAQFCCGDVIIEGAEAVNKSYPTFWEDLRSLGGKFEISY